VAVDRAHDEREFGRADGVENSFLHIEDHLRVGVVVDQADQEIAAQRQRARLRIGHVVELGDHRLDLFARGLVEQG
jgi:hypothetical protein